MKAELSLTVSVHSLCGSNPALRWWAAFGVKGLCNLMHYLVVVALDDTLSEAGDAGSPWLL